MNIFLNNTSGVPLYEQLSAQIKEEIITGSLKKGDALPSMRILAADLHVSVITTKRAYEDLAREGFLYSMPAKGYFVAEVNQQKIERTVKKNIEARLCEACTEARKISLSVEDLCSMLENIYRR